MLHVLQVLYRYILIITDCQISLQEYQIYKENHSVLQGNPFTDEDRDFAAREFKLIDQNGDDNLDWWEFVNHESKMYLAKRSKVCYLMDL